MGYYSLTFGQLLELPNFNPFIPEVMSQFAMADRLQHVITNNYYNREIAYDTPEYFKLKFNNTLSILSENYNKMLQSQLIEYDPFVTEFMEVVGTENRNAQERVSEENKTDRLNNRDTATKSDYIANEKYGSTSTDKHTKDNVAVSVNGKLYSEATNEDVDETTNKVYESTEKTKYDETKDTTKNTTTDTKKDATTTDTQTGRTWTENGSNQGHTLDVHSDTPQAMLFNEPNHYYGTGRAHNYGVVTTDAEGNDSYSHYPETEPSTVDTGSYKIDGGDTPWFNYASTADNNTQHSSYNKAGTETYSKGGTSKSTEGETSATTENTEVNGNKTVNTDGTEDITGKRETGFTKNSSENSKTDDKLKEAYIASGTDDHTKDNTSNTITGTKQNFWENAKELVNKNTKSKDNTKTNQFRKGRTGKSPATLLKDYRATLTFNADLWLFTELEPLFLGLF